jgi:hypothetical protein
MAKLSHKISNNDDNNDVTNNNLSFSLSTKKEPENNQNNVSISNVIESNNNIEVNFQKIESIIELEKYLFEKIGLENFSIIPQQQVLDIFKIENQIENKQAVEQLLRLLLNEKILEIFNNNVSKSIAEKENLIQKVKEFEEKIVKQDLLIKNLTSQIQDAEEQAFRIEKKYADTVSVVDLIFEFTRTKISNDITLRISELLLDAYKNGGKAGAKYVFGYLKGFVSLEESLLAIGGDEKENMEKIFLTSKNILTFTSDVFVSERRPILDLTASLINKYLSTYDFVSPEQTLQIDPTIHNADGLGGMQVKEGVTFAVVRRETRKAVFYATIKTK